MKKMLSLLLALSLLMGISLGAVAETSVEDALEAGREANSTVTFEWAGLPMLDETTNGIIAELLGSLSLSLRRALRCGDDETPFAEAKLQLGGQDALTFAGQTVGGDLYVDSNLLGGTVLIGENDAEGFFSNLVDYLVASEAMTQEQADAVRGAMTQAMDSMKNGAQTGLQMDEESFRDIEQAVNGWAEANLTFAPIELEADGTFMGEVVARAEECDLTFDQIVSFLETLIAAVQQNAAIRQALTMYEGQSGMTAEEMLAELSTLPQSLSETFAEDSTAFIARAFVEDDEDEPDHVVFGLSLLQPLTEGVDEDARGYADLSMYFAKEPFNLQVSVSTSEGPAFDLFIYAEDTEDESGEQKTLDAELSVTKNQVEYSSDEGAEPTVTQQTITLSLIGDSYRAETETGGNSEHDYTFLYNDGTNAMGARLYIVGKTAVAGDDVTAETETTLSFVMGEEDMPVLTIKTATQTGEASPLALDTAAAVRPGTMDAAAFAAWIEETLLPGALGAVNALAGLLPQSVQEAFFGVESVETTTPAE